MDFHVKHTRTPHDTYLHLSIYLPLSFPYLKVQLHGEGIVNPAHYVHRIDVFVVVARDDDFRGMESTGARPRDSFGFDLDAPGR